MSTLGIRSVRSTPQLIETLCRGGGGGRGEEAEVMWSVARRRPCGGEAILSLGRRLCTFTADPPTQVMESDVIVIGGGQAGSAAAIRAARMGFKTTCIEKRGVLGGTLPLVALFHLCGAKRALEVNLHMAIAQREKADACCTKSIEGIFKKNQVNYMKGTGYFVSRSRVCVNTLEGDKFLVNGKQIIIATGSYFKSSFPGDIKVDEKKIVSSAGALSLTDIPKRAVLIGSSYINLEIGSLWGRLGSEVTVVEPAHDIFPTMDGEVGMKFQSILLNQKVNFMLEMRLVGVDASSSSGVKLTIQPSAGGQKKTLEADVVVIPECRVPNTDGLHLKNIGIQDNDVRSTGGICVVNKQFSTGVPGVHAIGDVVTPGPTLDARKASDDVASCLNHFIAGKGRAKADINFDTVPGVIYTDPEVASVGMTEEQVKANGLVEYWSSITKMKDSEGIVKMLAEKKTNKVLGVHIISPKAEVKVGEAEFVVKQGGDAYGVLRRVLKNLPKPYHDPLAAH